MIKYDQKLDDLEKVSFLIDEIKDLVKDVMFEDIDDFRDLQEKMAEISSDMEDKINELDDFDIQTEAQAIRAYDDTLNECYPVSQLWMGSAAENMKENDPIMYRCGFNDWLDSIQQDGFCVPDYVNWSVE